MMTIGQTVKEMYRTRKRCHGSPSCGILGYAHIRRKHAGMEFSGMVNPTATLDISRCHASFAHRRDALPELRVELDALHRRHIV